MSLTSRIQIAAGGAPVQIDGHATHSVRVQTQSAGGARNLRMADGSIVRQVSWEARRVTLTCTGWIPPDLAGLDWSQQVVLTVPTETGTEVFIGYADQPVQSRIAAQAIDAEWTLTLDEG